MIAWPVSLVPGLVDGLADRIAAQRRRAWILRGPAGIGKSTVADAVAAALGARGLDVLVVAADPALADVPLGAFLPLLAVEDGRNATATATATNHEEQLGRLFQRLSRASSRAALIVDDAPALDDRSAATVHQLVKVYGVRCLITARPAQRLAEPILRLDDEGLAEWVDLDPLDENAAAEAVAAALDAPVASDSLLDLIRRTGGNPLMLRSLLAAAERSSLIEPSPRGLVIGQPPLPRRIAELLAEPLDGLGERESAALELVSAAGGLPGPIVDAHAVAELERLGLLVHAADGWIVPSSPLLAETVLARLDRATADRRRIDAARRLEALGDDGHRFEAVVLLADTSEPPSVDALAWAARVATTRHRYPLAITLAERADARAAELGAPRPVEALILRGEALSLLGRLDEADLAFEVALAADGDDAGLALAAARASSHWAIRRHDPGQAARLGAEALDRLTDPDARAFLEANIAKWRIMVGAAPVGPLATVALGGSEAAEAAAALDTNLFRVLAAVFGGDVDGARAAIAAGRPHASTAQPIVRHGAMLFDFAETLVLALDGRVGEAVARLEPRLVDRFAEGAGMWSYGAALLQRHAGRIDEAHRNAAAAVEQLAWRDFLGARGAAIAVHATTSALVGEPDVARSMLTQLGPALRAVVTADLQAAEAEAVLADEAGDPDAVDGLARAVDTALDAGYAGWIAFPASTAVRLGRPDAVVDALRAARQRSSAPLLRLVHEHAEAHLADDAVGLLEIAAALESAGLLAAAHDAARRALDLARADGTATARQAAVVASRTAAGLSPAPRRTDLALALTAREWDVAVAAAARERNREIATRLGLSLRTVENHLASVYRKLGIAGRDELRERLE